MIFDFTNKHERKKLEQKLIEQIEQTIQLKLNDTTYQKFEQAFWAMELMQYKPSKMEAIITNQFKTLSNTPP